MSTDLSQGSRKCMRCLGTLPEGVNFCVACGFNNDAGTYGKAIGAHSDAEFRRTAPAWLLRLVEPLRKLFQK